MQRLWGVPVNSFPGDALPNRDTTAHRAHEVYLRHALQTLPHIPQSTQHSQSEDFRLTDTSYEKASCVSDVPNTQMDHKYFTHCPTQRPQLSNWQWHAGNATVVGLSGGNAGDSPNDYFPSDQETENVRYAPWDCSARGKSQPQIGVSHDHLQGFDNSITYSSATPTGSEHSDQTFSTISTNSSFADSPHDWQPLQLHRTKLIESTMTPTECLYTDTSAPIAYPQHVAAGWTEEGSYWPAHPIYDRIVTNCCRKPACVLQPSRIASPNVGSLRNKKVAIPAFVQAYNDGLSFLDDDWMGFGQTNVQCSGHQQRQPGPVIVKRTPKQAREAAQDDSDSSTSGEEHDARQPKLHSEGRRDPSEPISAGFSIPRSGTVAHAPAEQNYMLVCWRRAGLTYKEIKMRGNFREAESTLRGRYRALTKQKHQRLRAPVWEDKDVELLGEIVAGFLEAAEHITKDRVPWKKVAELIVSRGGSYLFGPGTCKKKWEQLALEGHASVRSVRDTSVDSQGC